MYLNFMEQEQQNSAMLTLALKWCDFCSWNLKPWYQNVCTEKYHNNFGFKNKSCIFSCIFFLSQSSEFHTFFNFPVTFLALDGWGLIYILNKYIYSPKTHSDLTSFSNVLLLNMFRLPHKSCHELFCRRWTCDHVVAVETVAVSRSVLDVS